MGAFFVGYVIGSILTALGIMFLWALILISAINNGGGVVEENDRLENMEKNIQKLVAQVSVIESMLSMVF